jgi:hypothetical protein
MLVVFDPGAGSCNGTDREGGGAGGGGGGAGGADGADGADRAEGGGGGEGGGGKAGGGEGGGEGGAACRVYFSVNGRQQGLAFEIDWRDCIAQQLAAGLACGAEGGGQAAWLRPAVGVYGRGTLVQAACNLDHWGAVV